MTPGELRAPKRYQRFPLIPRHQSYQFQSLVRSVWDEPIIKNVAKKTTPNSRQFVSFRRGNCNQARVDQKAYPLVKARETRIYQGKMVRSCGVTRKNCRLVEAAWGVQVQKKL
jgi:hypothetical protein